MVLEVEKGLKLDVAKLIENKNSEKYWNWNWNQGLELQLETADKTENGDTI